MSLQDRREKQDAFFDSLPQEQRRGVGFGGEAGRVLRKGSPHPPGVGPARLVGGGFEGPAVGLVTARALRIATLPGEGARAFAAKNCLLRVGRSRDVFRRSCLPSPRIGSFAGPPSLCQSSASARSERAQPPNALRPQEGSLGVAAWDPAHCLDRESHRSRGDVRDARRDSHITSAMKVEVVHGAFGSEAM